MAFAGNKGDISHTTRCGFTGWRQLSRVLRVSPTITLASIFFDQSRSSLRLIRGSNAFSVSAASP
jgi:hypothetical protein